MNVLDLNLIFTSRHISNLEQRIRALDENEKEFSLVNASTGELILLKNDIPVCNKENPVQEIIDEFEKVEVSKENIYIIVGLELGYMLNFFLDNCEGKIIIYEPSLENIKYTFTRVQLYKHFNDARVHFATTNDELEAVFENVITKRVKVFVSANNYYRKEYSEIISALESRIKSFSLKPYEKGESLKLNIGPGPWVYNDWRTLDCYRDADFEIDLRNFEKFEIEDNCIEKAFSSHCFEHITDEDIQKVFNELYRTMKSGGIFRFSCPDAEKAINAYKNGDVNWFNWVKQAPIHEMLLNVFVSYEKNAGGPIETVEKVSENLEKLNLDEFIKWCVSLKDETRPYIAHTNGIYFDKMKKMLENAGFKNVVKSEFMQSKDEELRNSHFDKYPEISLYVECEK